MKNKNLIRPFTEERTWKEPVHDDFISREEFINHTGIFVTPSYFSFIYNDFKENNVPVDEYVNHYEDRYSTCVQKASFNGFFKYEITDDSMSCLEYHGRINPDIWEIMNCLARSEAEKNERYDNFSEKIIELINEQQELNKKMFAVISQWEKTL